MSGYFDYPFDKTGLYRYQEIQYTKRNCNTDHELFEDALHTLEDNNIFYDCQECLTEDYQGNPIQLDCQDPWITMRQVAMQNIFQIKTSLREPNYNTMLPNFGWAPIKAIKETLKPLPNLHWSSQIRLDFITPLSLQTLP